MAKGELISLAERRARKSLEKAGSKLLSCNGYSILYDDSNETVALVFDLGDHEATFIVPRAVARRMGWRVYIASERARRGGPR